MRLFWLFCFQEEDRRWLPATLGGFKAQGCEKTTQKTEVEKWNKILLDPIIIQVFPALFSLHLPASKVISRTEKTKSHSLPLN